MKKKYGKKKLYVYQFMNCIDNNFSFEILLNEKEGMEWIYRRDKRVKKRIEEIICKNKIGIPYLSPEIVLLYKTKNMKEKNLIDFKNILPRLSNFQKEWLAGNIKENPVLEIIKKIV